MSDADEDIAFLEAHDAILYFSLGKKIGLDWRRPDGLRLQCSGWSMKETVQKAREALKKWKDEQ